MSPFLCPHCRCFTELEGGCTRCAPPGTPEGRRIAEALQGCTTRALASWSRRDREVAAWRAAFWMRAWVGICTGAGLATFVCQALGLSICAYFAGAVALVAWFRVASMPGIR